MGTKLSWTGLALILISPLNGYGNSLMMGGIVILFIGVVLQWLSK